MTTPLEMYAQSYLSLGFDLSAAIDAYTLELEQFNTTENEPAPSAHVMVEIIVKQHGGEFVIVPDPEPNPVEPELLPTDPSLYRTPDEQAQIIEGAKLRASVQIET
jgi:hypothetical protein